MDAYEFENRRQLTMDTYKMQRRRYHACSSRSRRRSRSSRSTIYIEVAEVAEA